MSDDANNNLNPDDEVVELLLTRPAAEPVAADLEPDVAQAATEPEPPSAADPPAPYVPVQPRKVVRGQSRRRPRPWYTRSSVQYPGMFLIVLFGIFAWHWFTTPIDNLGGTGSHTRGQQVGKFIGNMINPRESLAKSFDGAQQINVLLIGLDHVPKTKKDPGIIHRNDSTLVASTDFMSKQIRIASIPRDGWVQHWQNGKSHGYEKFGHTHSYGQQQNLRNKLPHEEGGINRVLESTQHLLDIEVDHYVVIEFDGFIKLIDAMGGLDIDVEKKMYHKDRAGGLLIDFKKGLRHMNGTEVMGYARFRSDAMGDKARMVRQQKVIKLMMEKLKNPEMLPKLPELARILHESVQTSLSADQLLALAQHVDEYDLDEMETMSLPSYWAGEPGHERTLPGLSAEQQKAHSYEEYLAPSDIAKVHEFLTDLNAAPKASAKLQQEKGQAPFNARLDATGSSDRDGSVAGYEVDWNGDGNYEDQSESAILSHEYTKAGEYKVTIRVVDDKGKPSLPLSLSLQVTPAPEQAFVPAPGRGTA